MEWEGELVEETILRLVEEGGLGEGLVMYLGLWRLERVLEERRFLLGINQILSLGQLG